MSTVLYHCIYMHEYIATCTVSNKLILLLYIIIIIITIEQ